MTDLTAPARPDYFRIDWEVAPASEKYGEETVDAAEYGRECYEDTVEFLAESRYGLTTVGPGASIDIVFWDVGHYIVRAKKAAA